MLPERAQCLDCRYALAGVGSLRCPECGRGFDPADRLTFSVPGDANEWHRRALRAPGWPLNGIGAVACLMLLWAFGPPAGSYWMSTLAGGGLFFSCGVIWLSRADQARRVAKATGTYRTHLRPRWRRWLLLPAMFAVTLLLLQVQAPRHARFAIARASLERTAKSMLASPPTGLLGLPGSAGVLQSVPAPMYKIQFAEVVDGLVLVHVQRAGLSMEHPVLVYIPPGASAPAIPTRIYRVRHFTGPWHVGMQEY